MDFKTLLPILISAVAVIVAVWQALIAKLQLDQAKSTKTETEKLLQEVKEKVSKIESITDETRKDVREQISKLVDKQDENFKTLLTAPQQNSQNEMIAQLLPQLLANGETLKMLMDYSKKKKKKMRNI